MRPTRVLALAAAVVELCAGGAAEAASRALLIGVGDYPGLPPSLRLQAPAGDVAKLARALSTAGMDPSQVRVMTEHQGVRPTREAILQALEHLAQQAAAGDRILIYFSGHGAQAPARRPEREPDGQEELYLAADAAAWDGRRGMAPGSLADFELEAALSRILAKGADVWFVGDACHAGGLSRGNAQAGRAKGVPGAALGIPSAMRSLRNRSGEEASPLQRQAQGRFTGFYAAAPGVLALERRLPAGSTTAEPTSVFTYALVRAMGQGRFRTFRDLALATSGVQAGLGGPPAVFEGALGDGVLGLRPVARQFRVTREGGALMLEAGTAEGFLPGARVRLVTLPEGVQGDLAEVASADLASSVLRTAAPPPPGALAATLEDPAFAASAVPGTMLLAALSNQAGQGPAREVQVQARLWRQGCSPNPAASAGFPERSGPLDLLAAPRLRHCDVVYLKLTNAGPTALDVSPLYVDAAGAVTALTMSPQDDVRLASLESRFAAVRLVSRDAAGRPLPHGTERITIVVAEARGPRVDLRSLVQAAETQRGGPTAARRLGALIYSVNLQD